MRYNGKHMNRLIKNYAPLFGRILLGGFFLWNGVQTLLHLPATAEMLTTAGLPSSVFLATLVGAIEVLGGIGLVVGFHTRLCAAVLAFYIALVAGFLFNANDAAGTHLFLQRMAIVGGLLYVVAYGSGRWSTDHT